MMRIYNGLFKDANGKVVIFQIPNIPLSVYVITVIVGRLTEGSVKQIAGYLGLISLSLFAILELFYGVTSFRKMLGLAVILFIIISRVWR